VALRNYEVAVGTTGQPGGCSKLSFVPQGVSPMITVQSAARMEKSFMAF